MERGRPPGGGVRLGRSPKPPPVDPKENPLPPAGGLWYNSDRIQFNVSGGRCRNTGAERQVTTMSIGGQVCVILLSYGLGFVQMRLILGCITIYQLNNSARKKRLKGQSLKEWFLYSRFRDVLPRLAVIWYFIVVAIHPLILAVCVILTLADVPNEVGKWVAMSAPIFDAVWIIGSWFLFYDPKDGGYKWSRWIKKKRGMKK